MTQPRRVLIAFDYHADGIWWVATKEETEAPYEEWSRLTRDQHRPSSHRHGWEVLYFQDGRAHRVHPPASWPDDTWQQDLLGYPRRRPRWAPSAE